VISRKYIAIAFPLGALVILCALLSAIRTPSNEATQTESVPSSAGVDRSPALPLDSATNGTKKGEGETPTGPDKPAVSIADGARVTSRLSPEEWQNISERTGLSIEPKRDFILDPTAVHVDFHPLQAARRRVESRLQFDLGLNTPVDVEVGEVVEHDAEAYTLVGKIDGDPASSFSVSIYKDAVVGTFQSDQFGVRQLRFVGEGIHKVEKLDPAAAPSCGVPPVGGLATAAAPLPAPVVQPPTVANEASMALDAQAASDSEPAGTSGSSSNGGPSTALENTVLDVLVAYTPAAISSQGSLNALLALINQGIVDTNQIFSNSNIEAEVQLVGTTQVSYSGTGASAALSALQSQSDGIMDSVHGLRNTYGADFVSLWSPLSDACGIGYVMSSISTGFAPYAFNVCDPDCQFQYTFTHELGHNFGSHHAVGDSGSSRGGAMFNYSYGWRWVSNNSVQYRSVMAYSPGSRTRHYSNPSVRYLGTPTGRNNLEDNARSITQAKDTLAQFRGTSSDDHGNTPSTATTVSSNSLTSGNLEESNDVDTFRFTLNTNSSVSIYTTGSTNTGGRLRNASEAVVATNSNSGSNFNFRINATLSAGTYYVDVFGESGATGAYSLRVIGGSSTGDDHGNTTSTATQVPVPGSVSGNLETGGDVDYFRINVPAGGTLTVSTSGSTDTFGSLRNSNGTIIESDDDDGFGTNFLITRVLGPGTRYVSVEGYSSLTTGPYTLNVDFEETPDDHGNTFSEATDLPLGTLTNPSQTAAEFESTGDKDMFRFTIAAADGRENDPPTAQDPPVTLDIESPTPQASGTSSTLAIYNEDGFSIKPLGPVATSPPFNLNRIGAGTPANSDSGDSYLRVDSDGSLEIYESNGQAFDVIQMDLAEYTRNFAQPKSISWRGYKVDGSTVQHTITTDGINDGANGLDDFQTFEFPETFVGVIRLEALDASFCIDNIRVAVNDSVTITNGVLEASSTGSTDTVGNLYDSSFNLLESNDNGGSGSNFAISRSLPPGTYYLRLHEFGNNSTGNYTVRLGYELEIFPPAAPSGLSATQTDGSAITLTWDGIFGATGFHVYRNTVDDSNSATLMSSNQSERIFIDTTAPAGQTHYYWVVATNEGGDSPFSTSVSGYRPHPGPDITAQPADTGIASGGNPSFSIVAVPNQGQVHYQWYVGEKGVTTFPSGTDSPNLTLSGVSVELKVWVRVWDDLNHTDSETATVYLTLPQPTVVSASTGLSTSEINVRWLEVPNAVSYNIYRNTSDSDSGAALLGNTTRLSFVDDTAAAGQDYYYFVRAVNGGGFESAIGGNGSGDSSHLGTLGTAPLDGSLLPIKGVTDFAYSNDNSSLFVADASGWIDQYSIDAKQIEKSGTSGAPLGGIDVNAEGSHVFASQLAGSGGNGIIHDFDFEQSQVTTTATSIPLASGETGVFDLIYLDSGEVLASMRSPGTTSQLRQLNPANGNLSVRNDAATGNGRVGDRTFFAKRGSRQATLSSSYFNDFEAGAASLNDFVFTGSGQQDSSIENGQMRIALSQSQSMVALHLPSVMPNYQPVLSANDGGLVTWAFNLSYVQSGSAGNTGFYVGIVQPGTTYLPGAQGYAMRGGSLVGDRMLLQNGNAAVVNENNGLPPQPQIGAFRITYDPQIHDWKLYYEQGTSPIDPMSVTTLIGSNYQNNQVDQPIPYLQFYSVGTDGIYIDNLTVTASDAFPFSSEAAVFQAPGSNSEWFGIDQGSDGFNPSGTHSPTQRFGAVNAVGSMFAAVDASQTTVYDEAGNILATLPCTGGASFAPFTEQLYLVDDNTNEVRAFSTVDWMEDFTLAISGGVIATDDVFGQGRIEVRPDGLELAVSCADGIRFFDISAMLPDDAPLPPTSLTASDDSAHTLSLTWTESVVAESYAVHRHTSDDFGSSSQLASGLTGSTYTDASAAAGEIYYYWIVAKNGVGDSLPSVADTGQKLITRAHSLSASKGLSDRVTLNWQDDGPGGGQFEIYRGTTNNVGEATQIGTSPSNAYSDTTAAGGFVYRYWIRQTIDGNYGDFAGPTIGHLKLVVPSEVTATTTLGSKVTISWEASPGALEYEVYASNNFSVDENDRFVGVTSTNSIDDPWTNFAPGQPLYWAVRAKSGEAFSLMSNSAFGRRVLAPPTNVVATTDSLDAIDLSWTHVNDAQNEYRIYRSLTDNFAAATLVDTIPTPGSQWSDDDAVANTVYYYWVQGYQTQGGVIAGEPGGSASGVRVGGKYADYIAEYGLSGDDAILTNDPDGDGKLTIEEWALGGTDPLSSDDLPPYLLREVTVGGDTFPALCYLRLRGGTDVANQYEALELRYLTQASSGDLNNWDLIPVIETPPAGLPPAPTGYDWTCFRLPGTVDQYPDGFLRVQLSADNP